MASLVVMTKPATVIDYSLDGRIRSFELYGKVLYDEDEHIVKKNWMKKLATFIKENDLDVDDGKGLRSFVYKMKDLKYI